MSLSHKKLSGWYLQISQSLDAGLPLTEALDLAKGPPAQDVARIVSELKAGKSVDDVLAQAPKWLGKAGPLPSFRCTNERPHAGSAAQLE